MDYKRQHEIRKTAARICPAAGEGVQHIVCAETHLDAQSADNGHEEKEK